MRKKICTMIGVCLISIVVFAGSYAAAEDCRDKESDALKTDTMAEANGDKTIMDLESVDFRQRISPYGFQPGDYWKQHCESFAADNPRQATGGIVFIGDSLTERFALQQWFPPEMHLINRGIGGDRVEGLMLRLDLSASDLEPETIFLQIGINDLLWPVCSLSELKDRYGELLDQLQTRCPHSRLVIQTLLPLAGEFAEKNESVLQLNQAIESLAIARDIELIDLHPYFVGNDGLLKQEMTNDGVHLTEAGYAVWADQVKSRLK